MKYTIPDEDTVVIVLGNKTLEATTSSSNLVISTTGKTTLVSSIVLDSKFQQVSLAESSTYLVVRRLAKEHILRTECVTIFSDTEVKLAQNNTTSLDAVVLGMAVNDALPGEYVNIIVMGILKDSAFSVFGLRSNIFMDQDGSITDIRPVPPLANSYTIIGTYIGNNEIFINPVKPAFY